MSTLTILIGIPGCGKSSWIQKQLKKCKGISVPYIVCPDQIRKQFFGAITDQSNNTAVWYIAKGQIITALDCGRDVILDAVNVNTYYRKEFLKDIFPLYSIKAVLFDKEPSLCSYRIAKDIKEEKDRSNVPESVVYRMYGEFLYTAKVIEEEGYKEIVKI